MSSGSDGFENDAIVREWTWKSPAMRRMTAAVCRLALERGHEASFSALDLPEHGADAHGGVGIAGSVFRRAVADDVIVPDGVFVDGEFTQRRVRNAGGNPIGLWRLKSTARARALLRSLEPEGPAPREEQLEFTGAAL
jgi:hypothetical protein